MKKFLLILCPAMMFIASCKKDSNNTNSSCKLSASALVGSWQFSDATYKKTAASASEDIFNDSWFDTCERDNYTTFFANGTYNYVDAGVACTPNQSLVSDWHLSNDTLYTNANANVPNVISSFECNKMVISVKDFDVPGDEALLIYLKKS